MGAKPMYKLTVIGRDPDTGLSSVIMIAECASLADIIDVAREYPIGEPDTALGWVVTTHRVDKVP